MVPCLWTLRSVNDSPAAQIGGQRRQEPVIAAPPVVFDLNVAAVDEAAFFQAFVKARSTYTESSGERALMNPIMGIEGCCA